VSERWIVIPNWDKFQHYKDRNPAWIKLYLDLNTRDEWLGLTDAERGLLVSLWLEYARANGVLSTRWLHVRLKVRVYKRHLERLSDAGFIELSASKPLALARARVETETEKEPPLPPRRRGGQKITGWKNVRGSHGTSTIPDPFGTDPAPVG
jgi:hypothetical protein